MARSPSASAHKKVLQAALELVAEHGIDGTSMDAVARESGVSKATIYNHWADKEALLLELLAEASGLHSRPLFDTCDTRNDLIDLLSYRPQENREARERLLPHFVAYSFRNRAFGMAWRKMVMNPAMRELRRLIEQGIQLRELKADVDIELAQGLLLGPMLYWHIFQKDHEQVEDLRPRAEGVVDAFWKAFGAVRKA
jgi:AcrR family transcriptional regulator